MSNTFDKLSVLDSFIEEVNSYLPEIEANLGRLALSTDDMEALEETYRRAHTIGGSASMMDFPGLAHVAHGMEDILGDVLDNLATLDPPTLGLLHRSLQRIHRLIDGIRNGIDEDAIIAEDDADYTQYRSLMEASARGVQGINEAERNAALEQQEQVVATTSPLASSSTIPSLDEMLASFRTPSVSVGEEISWPEEPLPLSSADVRAQQDTQPRQPVPPTPVAPAAQQPPEPMQTAQPSALEMLAVASSRAPELPPVTPLFPVEDESTIVAPPVTIPAPAPVSATKQSAAHPAEPVVASAGQGALAPLQQDGSVAEIYHKMQQDGQVLEEQAASLKRTLTQLRLAASIVEAQRTEFKGFLDGSKDALDRMEEWAGKAMGLNLRNSPEQVRRYLPLSVMWVANSKLKKVLDLLTQMTSSVELTDEQMHFSMQQLQTSIEACGDVIEQLQTSSSGQMFIQDQGWTPWEIQVARDALRERVTFERRGDVASLRAEIEAGLREELRQEYEYRPMTLATRSELEQQIRNEVREEFEAKRKLQESVVGVESQESLQEIEARLRSEIEIEVRREFLSQLTGEVEESSHLASTASARPVVQPSPAPAPTWSPTVMPMTPASSQTAQFPASTPSLTGDFGEEAAEIFRLEAEEHLQTISMFVAALENAPTDRDPIQGIRRATHTLKGAAAMMGFRAIADLCHISEDLLDSVMEGTIAISPTVLSIILDTAEALDMLVNGKGTGGESDAAVKALRVRYTELLGEQPALVGVIEEELEAEIEASETVIMEEAVVTNLVGEHQGGADLQHMVRGDLSVRVPLTKLDELVNLFGEVLVNRSVLEERLQRLMRLVSDAGVSSNRLRDVGQKLESRFEAATLPSGRSVQVMPGQGNQNGFANGKNPNSRMEPAHLAEFDELELDRYTEFHQLARGLSEGISDMTTLSNEMEAIIRDCESVFSRENRLNTTFQDRLMKARLVPLSTMIPRLYRTARAVALKQHKEFEFVLEGQETEVDRTVIEEIAGPLLHLMRNAVNHAIETPEVRLQRGKPSIGQIRLSAAYEGNQVVITVRDDGTGIDPQRVRNAALAHNFIGPDQALSDADIIELIFRPGFSTAEVLSEESGRGVGLDVVRDSVSRLRGTLEVESTPGQGTAFTMKFPTSLAIQSAMMVIVGEQQFAIPTVMVEAIGRLDNFKQAMFAGRPAIMVQNELYPLILLSQLLGFPVNPPDEKAPVLLVHTDRHRVALIVDSIRGKMDVVMKNLGPHLRHVHGVAGGTVLGNGRVVLILELVELLSPRPGASSAATAPVRREGAPAIQAAVARAEAAPPVALAPAARSTTVATHPKQAPVPPSGKHVLVVDDSPSVRRVVGNMLKQNGWDVQLARDGVEALEMITRETPAAVLLDIEMPRMDGYELMATVRAQEQYRTLPLVILTSRAAAKHQQRAMQLGANAYVVKPYQDEELLNLLKSLVYGATV
ncbi:MAG TPA: response regulator [Ktedonobacteraceae bacterium]|nr:response regulator [Ktedonobacteraceae bacterium]